MAIVYFIQFKPVRELYHALVDLCSWFISQTDRVVIQLREGLTRVEELLTNVAAMHGLPLLVFACVAHFLSLVLFFHFIFPTLFGVTGVLLTILAAFSVVLLLIAFMFYTAGLVVAAWRYVKDYFYPLPEPDRETRVDQFNDHIVVMPVTEAV